MIINKDLEFKSYGQILLLLLLLLNEKIKKTLFQFTIKGLELEIKSHKMYKSKNF